MKFKKGSKVEVLSKIGVPSSSWRCAEIIDGNGHTYAVRYEGDTGTVGQVIERIPRKAIRPCPPLPKIVEDWAPGDVVEVFDDFSWKMAMITGVLGKQYFLARMLGSSSEFKVTKSDIRTRRSWQDEKWIVIGKGSGSSSGHAKRDENSTLKSKRNFQNDTRLTKMWLKDVSFSLRNKEKLQESTIISCRTLRQGPYVFEHVETYDGAAKKFRAIEKDGRLHRVLAANRTSFAEKIDDSVFPKGMVGEKFIHSSYYSQTGFTDMDLERRKQNGAVGCSSAIELESNDEDSVASSVGSCSITSKSFHKKHRHAGFIEDINGNCSDAESFYHRVYEEGNVSFHTNEELAAEIHRLELHAYRCTMEALYASGPLSWEQEELVTNLRLSLHISNDEHLMEGKVEGLYTSLPNVER